MISVLFQDCTAIVEQHLSAGHDAWCKAISQKVWDTPQNGPLGLEPPYEAM